MRLDVPKYSCTTCFFGMSFLLMRGLTSTLTRIRLLANKLGHFVLSWATPHSSLHLGSYLLFSPDPSLDLSPFLAVLQDKANNAAQAPGRETFDCSLNLGLEPRFHSQRTVQRSVQASRAQEFRHLRHYPLLPLIFRTALLVPSSAGGFDKTSRTTKSHISSLPPSVPYLKAAGRFLSPIVCRPLGPFKMTALLNT